MVLICGVANLLADGLSMAVGNYLSIRSHEGVLEAEGRPEEEAFPRRHAVATFLAFVVAGALPLVPYVLPTLFAHRFAWSIGIAFMAMFAIGASRTFVSRVNWWSGGLEMLGLGAAVTVVAYASGALISAIV